MLLIVPHSNYSSCCSVSVTCAYLISRHYVVLRPHFNLSTLDLTMAAKYTPPASPPSPSASFYDVSDEDEDEYNTIAHQQSRKGVKLLYSKSKVHPHSHPLHPRVSHTQGHLN